MILASTTATLAVLIGSFVGWLDLRTALRGRKLLDYASLIPLGLPGIVVAVALIQFWLRVPVAALAIVTMLIITAAIALATRLGRGKAGRQGTPPAEHAAVSQ